MPTIEKVIELAEKTGILYCAKDVYEQLTPYKDRLSKLNIQIKMEKYLSHGTILACDTQSLFNEMILDGLEVHIGEQSSDTTKAIGANPIRATEE